MATEGEVTGQTEGQGQEAPPPAPKTPPESPFQVQEPDEEFMPTGGFEIPREEEGEETPAAPEGKRETEPAPDETRLLRYAEELGLTSEFATKLQKAGLLEEALEQSEKRLGLSSGGDQEKPAEEDEDEEEEPEVEGKPEERKGEFTLNTEMLDPDTAEALKASHSHHDERLSGIEERLNGLLDAQRQAAEAAFIQGFDNWIQGLPEAWHDILGTEAGEKIDRKSPQWENRMRLLAEMDQRAKLLASAGKRISEEALRERALYSIWPEVTRTEARDEIRKETQRHRRGYAPRPSDRKGKELPAGEQKALQTIRRKLREKGVGEEGVVEEGDFLP